MKVYNLTDGIVDYRGRHIPPHGGWVDISDLTFIPDRDKKLEGKYLSFGSLPSWWHPPNLIPVEPKKEIVTLNLKDKIEVKDKIDGK